MSDIAKAFVWLTVEASSIPAERAAAEILSFEIIGNLLASSTSTALKVDLESAMALRTTELLVKPCGEISPEVVAPIT